MRYLIDGVRTLGITLRNFLWPPVTVQYPEVIRPRAERFRASFALLHEADGDEACIGCLQCERICPSQVIAIKAGGKKESPVTGKKRGYADDFVLDLSACIFCELCVQVCPTDAIVMTREPERAALSREDLVLTMPMLYANEKSKHRSWADATKLMDMQTPPKPPPAPTTTPKASPPPVSAHPAAIEPPDSVPKPSVPGATTVPSSPESPPERIGTLVTPEEPKK